MLPEQLELQLLGPFEVLVGGRPFPSCQPKQRALLALLALHVNTPVLITDIIDALWEESYVFSSGRGLVGSAVGA